jgi:hypothetical protein
MSDLLQRMIRRTRTPFPVIEPLPVSRYAPIVPGINAAAIGVESLESEALIDSIASTPRRIQTQDRIIDRMPFQSAISHRPPAPEPLWPERGTRPLQHPHVAASIRPAESGQEPPISATSHAESTGRIVPQEADTARGISDPSPRFVEAKPIQQAIAVDSTLSDARMRRQEINPAPNPLSAIAKAASSAVQLSQQPQQIERAPEVTISIGQIEVRAAHAPEPPRIPAFRPHLSLDDFLHGKSGAQR